MMMIRLKRDRLEPASLSAEFWRGIIERGNLFQKNGDRTRIKEIQLLGSW